MRENSAVKLCSIGAQWGLLVLLSAGTLSSQSSPDFSGFWQLNKDKSHVSPDTETMWMRIEHSGSTLMLNLRAFQKGRAEENQTLIYTIGSADITNTMHGAHMKSQAAWDGAALEIKSVAMFGNQALKMTDRWTLSPDGTALTLREVSQFAEEEERESVYVMERRTASQWPKDASSGPAESQYRNIQVVKGLPASKLPEMMGQFTRALGVSCTQCHVSGRFELDDRPDKVVARKMLQMTANLNAENFQATNAVTCWTCHRGSLKPALPPM